jgi:hypothetical protein
VDNENILREENHDLTYTRSDDIRPPMLRYMRVTECPKMLLSRSMFVSMKFSAFTERFTLATSTTAHQQHTLASAQRVGQTSVNIVGQQSRSTISINYRIMERID